MFRSQKGRKLVGIITNRDLKFEEDFSKKIKECMTSEHLVTAPEGITDGGKEDSCQGTCREASDRGQGF